MTMDYGACNVIYIDRRATDDVCDTTENKYEHEHHHGRDDQAQAQEQDQTQERRYRYLHHRQHNARDGSPSSTAKITMSTTSTTAMGTAATAGAALDRFDASRRRPAYYQRHPSDVCRNLDVILGTFARVFVCTSGQSCLDKIDEIYQSPPSASAIASTAKSSSKTIPESSPPPPAHSVVGGITPTIIFIDVTYEDEQRLKRISHDSRSPSPGMFRSRRRRRSGLRTSTSTSTSASSNGTATASSQHQRRYHNDLDDLYGMHLLQYLTSEIQPRGALPSVVLPVVLLRGFENSPPGQSSSFDLKVPPSTSSSPLLSSSNSTSATASRIMRYLDVGATDVLSTPLSTENVHALAVQAYKASREFARSEVSNSFTGAGTAAGLFKARPASFLGGAAVGGVLGTAGSRLSSGSGISSFGGDGSAGPLTAAGSGRSARKVSWVGVNEGKPYAYLREAMVSGLMNRICNPGGVTFGERIDTNELQVSPERRDDVAKAVGTWHFSAHDFTDDELVYGALVMLQHALEMPELEKWRISEDELIIFLLACRKAYNSFVLYHNFRHVVDVLQALFYLLLQIGALPPYSSTTLSRATASSTPSATPAASGPNGSPNIAPTSATKFTPDPLTSSLASLISPTDALTLLISAIGHDVGHPGVNNAFLVALNAPLAQLYNDRSVLESFHCAAYSQTLRRYWTSSFADSSMRRLMISTILATDMGLHFQYMADLAGLKAKIGGGAGEGTRSGSDAYDEIKSVIDGWNQKTKHEMRDLLCGLLIKCADICNVARRYDIAVQWAAILTDEFSNQGDMEKSLDMPTCLFGGPPDPDNLVKLGESQIGFISIFALPLFSAMSEVLPAMGFTIGELNANLEIWRKRIKGWMEAEGSGGAKGGLLSPDPSRCPISAAMQQARKASGSISSSSASSSSSIKPRRQSRAVTSTTTQRQAGAETDTDTDNYTEAESEVEADSELGEDDEEYLSPRSSFSGRSPALPAQTSASASVSSSSSSTSSTTTTTQKTSRQSSGGALRRAAAVGGARGTKGVSATEDIEGFSFDVPGSAVLSAAAVGGAAAITAGAMAVGAAAQPASSTVPSQDTSGDREQHSRHVRTDSRRGSDGSSAAHTTRQREEHKDRGHFTKSNAKTDTKADDTMTTELAQSSYSHPQSSSTNVEQEYRQQNNNSKTYSNNVPTSPIAAILSPSSAGMGQGLKSDTISPDVSPRSTSSHVHAYAQEVHNDPNKSDSILIDNDVDIVGNGGVNEHAQSDKRNAVDKEKSDRSGSVCNYSYPYSYLAQQGQRQQVYPQKDQTQFFQSHDQQQRQAQPQPTRVSSRTESETRNSDLRVNGSIRDGERHRGTLNGDFSTLSQNPSADLGLGEDQGQSQSPSPLVLRPLTPSSLYHQVLYGPNDDAAPPIVGAEPAAARSAALTSHPSDPNQQQEQQQQQQHTPRTPPQQQKRHSHHSSHHKILRRLPSAQDFRLKDGWGGLFSSSTSIDDGYKDRSSKIAPDAADTSSAVPTIAGAGIATDANLTINAAPTSRHTIDPEDTTAAKTSSTFFPTSFHNPFASSPFGPFSQFVPHSSSTNYNDLDPTSSSTPDIISTTTVNATAADASANASAIPLPPTTPRTSSPTRPTTSATVKTTNTTRTNKTTSTSAGHYIHSNGKPYKNVLHKKNPHNYPGIAGVPLPPSTPTHSTFTTATSSTMNTNGTGSGTGTGTFGFGFGSGGFLNSVRRRQSAPGGSGAGAGAGADAAAATAVKNVAREKEREGGVASGAQQQQQQQQQQKIKGDFGGLRNARSDAGGSDDGRISFSRRRFWRRVRG